MGRRHETEEAQGRPGEMAGEAAGARSDYARQEATRRFVIFVDGRLHGETTDHDQAMHVQQLLRGDGQKNVTVEVRTANQATLRQSVALQSIANSACPAPASCDSEGEDQGGLDAQE